MPGRIRKLTRKDQAWIRDAVKFRDTLTDEALAQRFRVSRTTIWHIAKDRYWERNQLSKMYARNRRAASAGGK